MLQKNYRFKTYIGIDPGKSGGICSIEDNRLRANKCPDSVQGMAELFKDILQDTSPKDVFLYITYSNENDDDQINYEEFVTLMTKSCMQRRVYWQ